ncbi:MAG: pilus assembly protein PilM [Planctomycetes bacterium]|nr:pilus assembly protein PilM [Planctomycetota bacterium]
MLGLDQQILCLDWDRRTLRFVVARLKSGRITLADAHAHRIPTNVDPEDTAGFGEFIGSILKRHNVKTTRTVLDVPRDKAVINRLKLAPTPAAELAAAVRFQALRELPFPLDEAQIDFAVMERDANKLTSEVLLAAVRNEVLARAKETCRAAGLHLLRVGLRPCANMVSVLNLPAMIDRRVLFIDVGPTVTEMDVFRGKSLVFSRAPAVAVPFLGGELMADDSVVMSAKAEIARIDRANEYESTAVEELLVEVTRTLQAYRAAETNGTIDQVIVAGGTGIENALLAGIDERFGFPAMLFDPAEALGVDAARAAQLRSFSASLGLAWGACKPGTLEIDFLNPKKPIARRETMRQKARKIGIAAAFVAGAGIGYAAFDYYWLSRELDGLKSANAEPAKKAKARRELQVAASAADDWGKEARERMWLEHLATITQKAVEISGTNGNPTQKLLVTSLTCNGEGGRISVKIACDDWEIARKLVVAINAVMEGGKPVYKATPQKWTEAKSGDGNKFKGSVQIDVDLLVLQAFKNDSKPREAMYRKILDEAL